MVIFLADQTVSAQSLRRAGRPGGLCQGSVGNCRIAWCTVGTVSGTVGPVGLSACRPLSASVGLCRRVLTAHAHGDCRNLIIWHCRSLSVTVGLSDLSDCRTCRDCRVYVGVLSVKTVGLSDRGSSASRCPCACCAIVCRVRGSRSSHVCVSSSEWALGWQSSRLAVIKVSYSDLVTYISAFSHAFRHDLF